MNCESPLFRPMLAPDFTLDKPTLANVLLSPHESGQHRILQ
jgi:hypothetical protein